MLVTLVILLYRKLRDNYGLLCFNTIQDQLRALDMIQSDPALSALNLIQAPIVDMEIRGVPALKFLGDIVWK